MSSFRVISKKNRLKLGIAVVVIIHIGFFYGFWHVKAGQIGNKVVGLDIYAANTDGLGYYEALPDDNCVNVLNEEATKPALKMEDLSSKPVEPGAQAAPQEPVEPFSPQLPIQPARSPKCKAPTALPDGYKKLGANGFVGLEVNVDKAGKVLRGDIDRTSGFQDLDTAALKQVVETWTFEPCKKGSEAVVCKQYIKFRWKETK